MISVFTACTPWLAFPELIPAVAAAGYDGMEIGLRDRVYDASKPPQFWNNNPAMIDYAHAESEAQQVRSLLDAHHLACSGLGSYASARDPQHFVTCLATAKILGAPIFRIRAPGYDAKRGYDEQIAELRSVYRDLGQQAQDQGTRVVIEIHDHSLCTSPSATMRVLEGCDPRGVGAIFEPANMLREGWEAIPQAIACLGPYLAHVHVKDQQVVVPDVPKDHRRLDFTFCSLGKGIVDWPSIISALKQAGYRGAWSIENFSDTEVGPDRLRRDYDWLAKLLA